MVCIFSLTSPFQIVHSFCSSLILSQNGLSYVHYFHCGVEGGGWILLSCQKAELHGYTDYNCDRRNIETIKEKIEFCFPQENEEREREKSSERERDTAQHLKNTDTLKKMNRGGRKNRNNKFKKQYSKK